MNVGYESTQRKVLVDGLPFTIDNLSPCYLTEEREIIKRDIENKLFDIFFKYNQR